MQSAVKVLNIKFTFYFILVAMFKFSLIEKYVTLILLSNPSMLLIYFKFFLFCS